MKLRRSHPLILAGTSVQRLSMKLPADVLTLSEQYVSLIVLVKSAPDFDLAVDSASRRDTSGPMHST